MNGLLSFETAQANAFWEKVLAHVRGKSAQLLGFDELRTRLRFSQGAYRGLHDIPVDKIVGSVGRYRDFTAKFLPTKTVDSHRWASVYQATTGELGVPPIEVYQVGEVYFVRDGNHRVSVARSLGFKTIQAEVTEIITPICFNHALNNQELDAAEAYVEFLNEIGLLNSTLKYEYLKLSEPLRYSDFMGHLQLHKSWMEHEFGPLDMIEVSECWHDTIYVPTVELMRHYDVLKHANGRTEADLYLWLVDHFSELEQCYTPDASHLSAALIDFLRARNLPIPTMNTSPTTST